jgi:hypothetical protein
VTFHRKIAVRGCREQGRFAVATTAAPFVNIGAEFYDHFHYSEVTSIGGNVKWRHSATVSSMDVSAELEKHLHHVEVVRSCCRVYLCQAIHAAFVDIRTKRDQGSHHSNIALLRCKGNGCDAILAVAFVDVGTEVFDEAPQNIKMRSLERSCK